jgi:Na+/H+-dicarboxylate symporter
LYLNLIAFKRPVIFLALPIALKLLRKSSGLGKKLFKILGLQELTGTIHILMLILTTANSTV